jgi:hypothetical protein
VHGAQRRYAQRAAAVLTREDHGITARSSVLSAERLKPIDHKSPPFATHRGFETGARALSSRGDRQGACLNQRSPAQRRAAYPWGPPNAGAFASLQRSVHARDGDYWDSAEVGHTVVGIDVAGIGWLLDSAVILRYLLGLPCLGLVPALQNSR